MSRKGILAAGNWIIDIVKIIDNYPEQDSLSNVLSQSQSNGGSPYNILKDLSNLEADFPLEAAGLVGADENGRFIFDDCHKSGINTNLLQQTDKASTSYTDVMTVRETGRRTFFHQRGSNALLTANHILLTNSNAKIFHLGYLMLLDKLDKVDENGKTESAKLFKTAQSLGFITSTDLVSENTDRFRQIIPPSLPFIDYLFINEFEIEKLSEINVVKDGELVVSMAKKAISKVLQMGVNKAVVLHYPKAAFAGTIDGKFYYEPSLAIPKDKIIGTVGAGDALAAGVLYGIHEEWDFQKSLRLGVCTAASCLFHQSCSEGVLSINDTMNLFSKYGV